MRSRTFTPKRSKPPFQRDLRESVSYCGELPYEHRGKVTDTLYIWTAKKPTTWIDRRDLPALLKTAGADNLDGNWIAEFKAHKAERQKEQERKKRVKAQSEKEVAE